MTNTEGHVAQQPVGGVADSALQPPVAEGYDMRGVVGGRYVATCETCGVVSSPLSFGSASLFAMTHHGVTGWHKTGTAPADGSPPRPDWGHRWAG